MFLRIVSSIVVIALVLTLSGASALAGSTQDSSSNSPEKARSSTPTSSTTTAPETKPEARKDEKLKASMMKLVADTKAGKVVPAQRTQPPQSKGNHFSKTAKIAIGVGIAAVIIAIIVKYQMDHMFDNLNFRGINISER
jgi:hypothetical protein